MIFLQKFNISKDVFRQFPLVLVFGILSTLLSLYLNHFDRLLQTELLFKIFYFFANSMVFSASLPLFFEKQNFSVFKKSIIYAVTFGLIGIVFLCGDTYSYVFMGFCSFLALIFAKFLFKSSSNEFFLFFANNLLKILFYTFVLIPIVLLGGIVLIWVSIEYLFGINFFWVIADISSVLFFIILPIYFISSIYKMNDFKPKMPDFGKFSSVFIQYVLIGLLSVYLIVLYIYFAKIIIFFELPKGGLSWMILIFSSFVILVKIFLLGVQNKHKLALLFDKYAFAFLLVPIVFLDIAIFRRIYDYGLTEFRIIVAFIDIWLSLVVVFYLLNKKLHFKYIFISLFIGFFTLSLPFINLEKIASFSQVERFKNILIQSKILQNGKLVFTENISEKTRKKIANLSDYLANNAYAKPKIEKLLKIKIYSGASITSVINIGISKVANSKINDFRVQDNVPQNRVIDVKGYDYFFKNVEVYGMRQSIYFENNRKLEFKFENEKLMMILDNEKIMDFDIPKFKKMIEDNNITSININNLKYTTLIKENKNIKARLEIQKFYDIESSSYTLEMDVSIKEKK